MRNNILVLGGTGKTGRRIVERLTSLGHNVRIGSRGADPSFDWDKPETWSAALEGMDKVYITFQPDLAVPGALEAIEGLVKEAKRQGVRKAVLLSGKGEREAELCEQVVINSGLDHTIVRASWFNQNFSESFFLEPILHGFVALPHADVQVPYVDADDIADVAVKVLLDDDHNGAIYELTGPRLLTFKEIVSEIAEASGREIAFTPISLPAYIKIMEEQGVPADYVWLINYLFSEVLTNPDNHFVKHDIEKVLGRKPIDFSDYVKKTVMTGVWNPKVEA
ncbi:NAD(P)H-binding protein [Flagellimonas nanhaiensis]|uniref:NmrA family transcriptional regulator n=1 Tax=Flagellimonas nanhaiensis TaxID=2292706 RepID=A0A371JP81_9FLAO|nr:NAD(P)H-binding protein [Allomuricauda nanhaiensis]RDY59253.1 NmrA family transcriptional regulator [Allomuricauda nanhaiensis]